MSVAVVSGPPGVGKSRLAAELARRTKNVAALWGRCLSYGDGITYWPLREVVQQAQPREERDAVLAALDADTPPPTPEIAWIFRQFCESLAADEPLVLVFDDIHWAEPTFLELIELLADRGQGRIFVVCLARDELLEDRPSFLEDRSNVERTVLDALSAEHTDALLDGLGGAILESDQRARISDTAEGNPFFVEQLFALALEGGLAEQTLPETVQALLAARLDRLGPGERAVLERGSIVLRGFTQDDVAALLDPDAAPTVTTHLGTLVARGFLRPAEENAFRFRHVIVQEAVYRSAPKRLRAELHERFADRLDKTAPDLAELDEFVGYHLERAYGLRSELGEPTGDTERLAEDGGLRLGAGGIRACSSEETCTLLSTFSSEQSRSCSRRCAPTPSALRAQHRLCSPLVMSRRRSRCSSKGSSCRAKSRPKTRTAGSPIESRTSGRHRAPDSRYAPRGRRRGDPRFRDDRGPSARSVGRGFSWDSSRERAWPPRARRCGG